MNISTPTFRFGKNWRNYLKKIDTYKIEDAKISLQSMLGINDLTDKIFLDAGCGSGLFSLSAIKLGAKEVVSFDVDKESTECANLLFDEFGPYDNWKILNGSVLDKSWLKSLGKFDIAYSWGVLHLTGNMYLAFENIIYTVKDGGLLFISIYNDQGFLSRIWIVVKKIYNRSISPIKFLIACGYFSIVVLNRTILGILKSQPIKDWYKGSERGMNLWNDTVDWVGGYPFEVASAIEIETFFKQRNFSLVKSKLKKGSGCNEFVFRKLQ